MHYELDNQLKISDYNISLSATTDNKVEKYNKILSTIQLDNIDNYTLLRQYEFELDEIKYNSEYLNWLGIKSEDLKLDDSKPYLLVYALGNEQYLKYIKSLGLKH